METTLMRVPKEMHEALRELATQDHVTLMKALTRAVEMYRRVRECPQLLELAEWDHIPIEGALFRAILDHHSHRLLEDTNAAYAALRADPEAWRELQQERDEWDGTTVAQPATSDDSATFPVRNG